MTLFLLRHGDSTRNADDDILRELTATGKEQARVAAYVLRRQSEPVELIIASPFTRTQQTATIVKQILGLDAYSTSEYLVPGSNPKQLVDQLNTTKAKSVLLVSHEPQLKTIISKLLSGSEHVDIFFGIGSLACLAISHPMIYGKGALRWLLTYEQMWGYSRV